MIKLIAAVSRNGVIGKDNQLPWNIPEDLRRFKDLTVNQRVLMGRKTFESIFAKIGRPLPKRTNIILCREGNTTEGLVGAAAGCIIVHNLTHAFSYNNGYRDLCVIGGSEVYCQAINFADELVITWIDKDFEGDAFFPEIDEKTWKVSEKVKGAECEQVGFDYWFMTYRKKKPCRASLPA